MISTDNYNSRYIYTKTTNNAILMGLGRETTSYEKKCFDFFGLPNRLYLYDTPSFPDMQIGNVKGAFNGSTYNIQPSQRIYNTDPNFQNLQFDWTYLINFYTTVVQSSVNLPRISWNGRGFKTVAATSHIMANGDVIEVPDSVTNEHDIKTFYTNQSDHPYSSSVKNVFSTEYPKYSSTDPRTHKFDNTYFWLYSDSSTLIDSEDIYESGSRASLLPSLDIYKSHYRDYLTTPTDIVQSIPPYSYNEVVGTITNIDDFDAPRGYSHVGGGTYYFTIHKPMYSSLPGFKQTNTNNGYWNSSKYNNAYLIVVRAANNYMYEEIMNNLYISCYVNAKERYKYDTAMYCGDTALIHNKHKLIYTETHRQKLSTWSSDFDISYNLYYTIIYGPNIMDDYRSETTYYSLPYLLFDRTESMITSLLDICVQQYPYFNKAITTYKYDTVSKDPAIYKSIDMAKLFDSHYSTYNLIHAKAGDPDFIPSKDMPKCPAAYMPNMNETARCRDIDQHAYSYCATYVDSINLSFDVIILGHLCEFIGFDQKRSGYTALYNAPEL